MVGRGSARSTSKGAPALPRSARPNEESADGRQNKGSCDVDQALSRAESSYASFLLVDTRRPSHAIDFTLHFALDKTLKSNLEPASSYLCSCVLLTSLYPFWHVIVSRHILEPIHLPIQTRDI